MRTPRLLPVDGVRDDPDAEVRGEHERQEAHVEGPGKGQGEAEKRQGRAPSGERAREPGKRPRPRQRDNRERRAERRAPCEQLEHGHEQDRESAFGELRKRLGDRAVGRPGLGEFLLQKAAQNVLRPVLVGRYATEKTTSTTASEPTAIATRNARGESCAEPWDDARADVGALGSPSTSTTLRQCRGASRSTLPPGRPRHVAVWSRA